MPSNPSWWEMSQDAPHVVGGEVKKELTQDVVNKFIKVIEEVTKEPTRWPDAAPCPLGMAPHRLVIDRFPSGPRYILTGDFTGLDTLLGVIELLASRRQTIPYPLDGPDVEIVVERRLDETRWDYKNPFWIRRANEKFLPKPPAPETRTVCVTPAEDTALDLLSRVWDTMSSGLGPVDTSEVAGHVHALQRMILANVAARAFPDRYRTH